MPTHAHGHGYSDLNFLIPELVAGVQFNKGPYAADEGDFSTAGASHVGYTNTLDAPMIAAAWVATAGAAHLRRRLRRSPVGISWARSKSDRTTDRGRVLMITRRPTVSCVTATVMLAARFRSPGWDTRRIGMRPIRFRCVTSRIGDRPSEALVGFDTRHDNIGTIGLYHTVNRVRKSVTREDAVRQTSAGAFAQYDLQWTTWLRSTLGVRADRFQFDVAAGNSLNSGRESDSLISPKLAAISISIRNCCSWATRERQSRDVQACAKVSR